jgi:ABC-type branched-subunit amino acid transport system substrate-binding protein
MLYYDSLSLEKWRYEGMRKARVQGKWFCVLAVALAALLLVTACASPTTPPTGEKVLEIGDLAQLTGGGASADQPCFMAVQDYVRYFNEEKGIPGVPIELVWRDSATDNAAFISGYRILADHGVPLIYSSSTNGLEATKSRFEKDQIPAVAGGATGPLVYPPGWVYCAWATQGEAATAVLDYFMENWNEERSPKLQFFVVDGSFGRGPAEEATRYAETIGFEVLPLELCGYVVIDATTQLLRIREREADLVYIQNIITGAGPIMRDAERLGLQENMQFAGTEWSVGEPLIEMAPVGVEGFLAARALPWFAETEIPGIKTMIDRQTRYHGKAEERPEYMGGWVYGAIVCEAVKRALDDVGYENVDGPAVKRALEGMKDFDVDGMVKITFGPEDRRGTRDYAVYEVQSGKLLRVTDWREVPILVP